MRVDGLSMVGCLTEISARLTDAAAIARAAVTCAESGAEREALRIILDLDEKLHEANTLHQAAVLLGRVRRRAEFTEDAWSAMLRSTKLSHRNGDDSDPLPTSRSLLVGRLYR